MCCQNIARTIPYKYKYIMHNVYKYNGEQYNVMVLFS